MKTHKLRIGNFVEWDNEGFKVAALSKTHITVMNLDETALITLDRKQVNGIKLTEKWLLSFGFKFTDYDIPDEDKNDEIYRIFKLPCGKYEYEIDICPDGLCDFIICHKWYDEICITTIKHVHELQNLYFSLHDEELPFKKLKEK